MSPVTSIDRIGERLANRLPMLFPCPEEKRELQAERFFGPVTRSLTTFSDLGLRDRNFDRDFVDGSLEQFYARYWEIEIALHFHRLGYVVSRGKQNLGPDFLVTTNAASFYVEARTLNPTPKLLEHTVEKPGQIVSGEVPVDEILLRYTQALAEKRDKVSVHFERRRDNRVPIVVALNAYRAYPFFDSAGTHLPFVVRAVLPFGPLYLTIDTKTLKTIDQGMHYRDSIFKKPENKSPVRTDVFLKDEWRGIAAVLATHRMFESDLRHGLAAVHNPKAYSPLNVGLLGARSEYVTDIAEAAGETTITTRDALAA